MNNMINIKYMLEKQKGQASVILAMTLVVFLTFTGVAIDEANIFLKKLELQGAVDAGSISGLMELVGNLAQSTPSMDSTSKSDSEAKAREIVTYNLKQMGIYNNGASSTLSTAITPLTPRIATLRVSASTSVRALFMGMIMPGAGDVTISATSVASRKPSVISLVLDYCDSRGGAEIQAVKNAAVDFLDNFPTNLDDVAVITFCGTAYNVTFPKVTFPMSTFTDIQKNNIISAINSAPIAGGDTRNTSEALELAGHEIRAFVSQYPQGTVGSQKAIILFTSGSPNVMRGQFLRPIAVLPQSPPASGLFNYYVNTALSAMTDSGFINAPLGPIQNFLLNFQYRDRDQPPRNQGYTDKARTQIISQADIQALDEVRREAYDLAIIEADYAKNFRNALDPADNGVAVYTIATNPAVPVSTVTGDAYQDVNVTDILKPYFLKRLANVRDNTDPEFEEGGAGFNPAQPEGIYLPNPTTNQIKDFARRFALRNAIRLIA